MESDKEERTKDGRKEGRKEGRPNTQYVFCEKTGSALNSEGGGGQALHLANKMVPHQQQHGRGRTRSGPNDGLSAKTTAAPSEEEKEEGRTGRGRTDGRMALLVLVARNKMSWSDLERR